jgi:hypothetical protein
LAPESSPSSGKVASFSESLLLLSTPSLHGHQRIRVALKASRTSIAFDSLRHRIRIRIRINIPHGKSLDIATLTRAPTPHVT